MLQIQTKTKFPSLLNSKVIIEVSNGEEYSFTSKQSSRLNFILSGNDLNIVFRSLSKDEIKEPLFFVEEYGAFQNDDLVLRINIYRFRIFNYNKVLINEKWYNIPHAFKPSIKEFDFYCSWIHLFIGSEVKARCKEDFKIYGLILVSFLWVYKFLRQD